MKGPSSPWTPSYSITVQGPEIAGPVENVDQPPRVIEGLVIKPGPEGLEESPFGLDQQVSSSVCRFATELM